MTSSRRRLRSGRQPLCAEVTRVFVGTLALLLALHMPVLQAEVVISNLPNTALGGSTISDTAWKAMLFTTGSSPTQLDSVVVGLNPNPTTESTPFTQQVKVSLLWAACKEDAAGEAKIGGVDGDDADDDDDEEDSDDDDDDKDDEEEDEEEDAMPPAAADSAVWTTEDESSINMICMPVRIHGDRGKEGGREGGRR